jgi:predicted dehydrogenase
MQNDPVRWGVVGCSSFARSQTIPALVRSTRAKLVAIASRSLDKARETAKENGAARAYGSYEKLLDDPDIEAVYVPLPTSLHAPWAIAALRAGKHALVEKSIAMNAAQAREMQEAATENDRICLEAFMYRFSPMMQKAMAMVREGVCGDVVAVHSEFCYVVGDSPDNVRLQKELGGGALYDAGCYAIDVQRMLLGREPQSVQARITWSEKYDVDLAVEGVLDYGGGVRGTFFGGMNATWGSYFRVHGSGGRLEAPEGFLAREPRPVLALARFAGWENMGAQPPERHHVIDVSRIERIECEPVNPYILMIDDFCAAVRGEAEPMFGREGLDANVRVIDACFESDRTGREAQL